MQFSQELIADVLPELKPLLARNFSETGAFNETEFSPDYERYLAMEASGLLRLFTVRKDGEIVGYQIFFLVNHLHYKKMYWAMQDILFVSQEHRGPCSVRFIRWSDLQLKNDGVEVIYRHVSRKRDYSRTLERMGYDFAEVSFVRRFSSGS